MSYRKSVGAIQILIITLCAFGAAHSAGLKDAESATHATDASQYRIVDTYEYPDIKVVQFEMPVLSIYTYLLTSGNEAFSAKGD